MVVEINYGASFQCKKTKCCFFPFVWYLDTKIASQWGVFCF